ARRMWVELARLGITVAASTVRQVVRQCRQRRQTAYVPLSFEPGERAEFDCGHAMVVLAGERRELPYLAGRLRYSGAMFLEFFPRSGKTASCWGNGMPSRAGAGSPRPWCTTT